MPKRYSGSVTLHWSATSLKELRKAAHDRAIEDGLGCAEARTYLKADASTCAQMLLDPGVSPIGLTIDESTTESAW